MRTDLGSPVPPSPSYRLLAALGSSAATVAMAFGAPVPWRRLSVPHTGVPGNPR